MIEVFSHTEAGGHIENQDAFAVLPHPLDPASYLCVVADGQGGRSGAAAAAQLACRVSLQAISNQPPSQLLLPSLWTTVLQAADRAVAEDPVAGFTTIAGFCISADRLCGASSGDSAVLMVGGNAPCTILTARQHKNPPVGSGSAAFVGFSAKLAPSWKVLSMTDGVWKYAGWQAIMTIAAAEHGRAILSTLRERASLPRTGELQDDFTGVLLQNNDSDCVPLA